MKNETQLVKDADRIEMAFETRSGQKVHALWNAATIAIVHVILCTVYIWFSGFWAEAIAASKEQLQQIEALKGTAFVVTTGLVLFALAFSCLRRIERNQEVLRLQQHALLQAERKIVAARCSASLVHDLNNLLMSLHGLVDSLKGHEQGDEFLIELRRDIELGVQRLAGFAKRIYLTANQVISDEYCQVDLRELIDQMSSLLRKHPDVRLCTVAVSGDPVLATVQRALFE
ncbi:MAG TPA: hypothetical protein VJ521_01850, partial [Acidobacteriota bacterium]|nr:hypothetical protein [Acidobacteriota bacterium]